MSIEYFSQRPARVGEWANFARRSANYCVTLHGLPSTLSQEHVEDTLKQSFSYIDGTFRIGTDADGAWAVKVTFFTRKRAKRCYTGLLRDNPFGGCVKPRLVKDSLVARGAADALRENVFTDANVLAARSCAKMLNATVGFHGWSTTITSLKGSLPQYVPPTPPPPRGGQHTNGRQGQPSSNRPTVAGGPQKVRGSTMRPAGVTGPTPGRLPATAAAAAASREHISADFFSDDLQLGRSDALPAQGGAADEEEPASAVELGLIFMTRALVQLPSDALDRRSADDSSEANSYDSSDPAGSAFDLPMHADTRGQKRARADVGDSAGNAFYRQGSSSSSLAPASSSDGVGFGLDVPFIHSGFFVQRGAQAPEGRVKPTPVRHGLKKCGKPAASKPLTALAVSGGTGPCVHSTVAVSWRMPDGSHCSTLGKGGCGCERCAAGKGKGYTAPPPWEGPGPDGAEWTSAGLGFTGPAAEAASGRALAASELRVLSDHYTAALSGEMHAIGAGAAPAAPVVVLRGANDGSMHVDADAPRAGLCANKWAGKEFDAAGVAGTGSHLKATLGDALRDACAGIRVWVPVTA